MPAFAIRQPDAGITAVMSEKRTLTLYQPVTIRSEIHFLARINFLLPEIDKSAHLG